MNNPNHGLKSLAISPSSLWNQGFRFPTSNWKEKEMQCRDCEREERGEKSEKQETRKGGRRKEKNNNKCV